MAVAVLLALGFVLPPQHVLGQDTTPAGRSVIVTSTADAGPGTLRRRSPMRRQATSLPSTPSSSRRQLPVTISLQSGLPAITAGPLTIDASNAGVILDGSGASFSSGLRIRGADGVTIRGLQILNFPRYGIELTDGARNAVIGGSRHIGAAPSGTGQPDQRQLAGWHPHPGTGTSGQPDLGQHHRRRPGGHARQWQTGRTA